jgi:hypothetical protein
MARLGRAITFSNVIACIALFVALGGSVYAAAKIDGKQIKAKSIPGNRIKPKTLTAKQVKPRSLTGAQIKTGSLTGTQVVGSTLSGVTSSRIASIQYATATVALSGASPAGDSGTATCPAGTNVIGGGAVVSDDALAVVNDLGPNSTRNGWDATGFGEPGTTMTITAICTAAAGVSG